METRDAGFLNRHLRWRSRRRNMRRSLFGVVIGTVLAVGLITGTGSSEPAVVSSRAFAPNGPASSTLTTHVIPSEGGPHAVVVVDASQRVMAVYHVDRASGEIILRSVRNLTWDLQMMEFNSGEPLPQDIRDMRGELQQ
jgi:hypothetical protein